MSARPARHMQMSRMQMRQHHPAVPEGGAWGGALAYRGAAGAGLGAPPTSGAPGRVLARVASFWALLTHDVITPPTPLRAPSPPPPNQLINHQNQLIGPRTSPGSLTRAPPHPLHPLIGPPNPLIWRQTP